MAYKIELTNWYQEIGEQKEFYLNLDFKNIEDACYYLGKNIDEISEIYPVSSIKIGFFPSKQDIIESEYNQNFLEEQARDEENFLSRLNDLYYYGDDGFCNGFAKY